MFEVHDRPRICVVGAGIIGMGTATVLQEHLQADVTIMASEFSPNLTSDIAGGFIEPNIPEDSPEFQKERFSEWCWKTMQYIRNHIKQHPGGAAEISGYFFTNKEEGITPFWAKLMHNFRILTPQEIREKHPLPQKSGYHYSTLYLEPTTHIAFLTEKFMRNGGKMVRRKLKSLEEIFEDYDIVVNCSGIGAKSLLGDEGVHPIRGQVIRASAPGVKQFFIDDEYYLLLNDKIVIMGGTFDFDNWDTSVDQTTAWKIIEGNTRNEPILKNATILSHHVGLRPHRADVRLEVERKRHDGREIIVAHNYGHGGSGVSLFWGCALDVLARIQQEITKAKL